MANGMRCANCGKGVMFGHNVSHAKNRTQKIFKPNLHSARVMVNGGMKRMRLCTKCLRMYKRFQAGITAAETDATSKTASA